MCEQGFIGRVLFFWSYELLVLGCFENCVFLVDDVVYIVVFQVFQIVIDYIFIFFVDIVDVYIVKRSVMYNGFDGSIYVWGIVIGSKNSNVFDFFVYLFSFIFVLNVILFLFVFYINWFFEGLSFVYQAIGVCLLIKL